MARVSFSDGCRPSYRFLPRALWGSLGAFSCDFPTPMSTIDFSAYPDEHGRFGQYGGSYVAETLM
ncbi:hypothetical protein, partial [Salmonella enterica]|uniref:hypothetical protein n=1 Tax=Salmonella enterica TaxID=28901 RepID=UPI0021B1816C